MVMFFSPGELLVLEGIVGGDAFVPCCFPLPGIVALRIIPVVDGKSPRRFDGGGVGIPYCYMVIVFENRGSSERVAT